MEDSLARQHKFDPESIGLIREYTFVSPFLLSLQRSQVGTPKFTTEEQKTMGERWFAMVHDPPRRTQKSTVLMVFEADNVAQFPGAHSMNGMRAGWNSAIALIERALAKQFGAEHTVAMAFVIPVTNLDHYRGFDWISSLRAAIRVEPRGL